MGIWANYTTCQRHELALLRDPNYGGIEARMPPYFEYNEMYKHWYGLYLIITGGLSEPTEDNVLSNAVAGQYFLYGNNSEWGNDCWWWGCYCPASNDHLRVKEISIELNLLDADTVFQSSRLGMSDELTSVFQCKFYELRDFYA